MSVKKVLVVLGSPRKQGNSAILAGKIVEGAEKAGCEVETIYLHGLSIAPCSACEGCHKPDSNGCVIPDDMREIYPKLDAADAIVLVSPIYWFTVTAQLKTFLDRCYATFDMQTYSSAFTHKKLAFAFTYGDPDPLSSGVVNAARFLTDGMKFSNAEIVGTVHASAHNVGDINKNEAALEKAFNLGSKLFE